VIIRQVVNIQLTSNHILQSKEKGENFESKFGPIKTRVEIFGTFVMVIGLNGPLVGIGLLSI